MTPDQYDLAAFKWNGQAWERIFARLNRNALEFGTSASDGIFSVQGQWRNADANLGLAMSAAEAGRPTVPITMTGQYRYSSLPTLQNEFVPAQLTLKLDTSGGTGQITGDDSRDKTLSTATFGSSPTRDSLAERSILPMCSRSRQATWKSSLEAPITFTLC